MIFANLPTPSQNVSVGKGYRVLCSVLGFTIGCVWWSDSAKCRVTDRTQAYFCTVLVSVILIALLRTYRCCTESIALFYFACALLVEKQRAKKLCRDPDG